MKVRIKETTLPEMQNAHDPESLPKFSLPFMPGLILNGSLSTSAEFAFSFVAMMSASSSCYGPDRWEKGPLTVAIQGLY